MATYHMTSMSWYCGMIYQTFKSLRFFTAAFLCILPVAQAAENLNFNAMPGEYQQAVINAYLKGSTADLARTDLNEDGIYEFIARTRCSGGFCTFNILAERKDHMISLGEIKARSLALGNGYSAGVRNIVAYMNPANEYEPTVYSWTPTESLYKPKK